MATSYFASEGPFSQGIDIMPLQLCGETFDATNIEMVTTGYRFTLTTIAGAPLMVSVGGRPAIASINTGATATDGNNWCIPVAQIIAQPNKRHVFSMSYYSTAVVTTDFAFGMCVVGTAVLVTDPTDHVMIRKLAAATSPSIRCRKASGTAETWTMANSVLTAAAWWNYRLVYTPSSTAGVGRIQAYAGASLAAGAAIPLVADVPIATQSPDTVAMAPFFVVRAGSAANITQHVGHFAYAVEA